jgi:hypothetical protein
MLAKSHDGTIAPQHVIARHRIADTLGNVRSELGGLDAVADQALADLTAELQPATGETFRVYVHYVNGEAMSPRTCGWYQVYNAPSLLTRILAARIAALRSNPGIDQVVIMRSRGQPARLDYKHRRFCETQGIDAYFLKVAS